MSDFNWPSDTDNAFLPARMEVTQRHNQRASVSPLSGYTQTLSVPGMRWGFILELGFWHAFDRQRVEAFISDLNGMENRVGFYDIQRPQPLNNMLGNASALTLTSVTASAAAQFATAITLNGVGNTKQMKAGDWFSVVTAIGVQLCMNMADGTSNAGGALNLTRFKPGLRAAVSGGAAVVLDKPRAMCVNISNQVNLPRLEGFKAGTLALEFVERFAA
jgi:hypothetical protein